MPHISALRVGGIERIVATVVVVAVPAITRVAKIKRNAAVIRSRVVITIKERVIVERVVVTETNRHGAGVRRVVFVKIRVVKGIIVPGTVRIWAVIVGVVVVFTHDTHFVVIAIVPFLIFPFFILPLVVVLIGVVVLIIPICLFILRALLGVGGLRARPGLGFGELRITTGEKKGGKKQAE